VSVLVVGSVAYDTIKTPFGMRKRTLGGSAVHFSLAASLLSKVYLIGVVGKDFKDEDIEFLKSKGINIDGLEKKEDGRTFFWQGYYEYDMNQAHTIVTELNVFENFKPVIPENLQNSKYIFLANIDPDIQLEIIEQMTEPELIVCDTMNYWIENKKEKVLEVFKKSNIVLINDSEARELFSTPILTKCAKKILKLGVDAVVIKKGEHGSILFKNDFIFLAPAYPLEEIIDPTGAGDSFAGGFVSYIEHKNKITDLLLRQAIIYGTVVASFNVQGFGIEGVKEISYSDVVERYKMLSEMTTFETI